MRPLPFILLVLTCFTTSVAHAENDIVIIDKMSNRSIVSGTITRIQGDDVFITSTGRDIRVDMHDLDIDRIEDVFAPGMAISAKGRFTDDGYTPVFKADKIVSAGNGTVFNPQPLLFQNDDDD